MSSGLLFRPASIAKSPAAPSVDAATECMVGVPTNCAVGALVACGLLALLLLVLGVSRYTFLVIWCVGIPFAAALGGGLVAWLQLRRPPTVP